MPEGAAAECFALMGGLPETYRAARPLPGAVAGKRTASTVESFGMTSVSSVYSTGCQRLDQYRKEAFLPSLEFSL